MWQGPLNGGNTQYQYLYCNSSTPHQLTGMYPLGITCSNKSGAVYKTSYDSWGNATSRTYNGTTTTQTFDLLDQLVKWVNGTTQKQWYAYNTDGERTLLRSTNGSATTMTVYAFGAEEYSYDGSGNLQSSTHYYDMGGRLIGELTGGGTQSTDLFLTDALGSVLTTFSNTQNSAAVQGNQVYGPYGTQHYNQGSMDTNKGYTGQYADPLTGFDYYNARYYDPVCGTFLSADPIEGNMQGMNPYAYVDGNPETFNDPTGEMYAPPGGGGGGSNGGGGGTQSHPTPPPSCNWWCWLQQQGQRVQDAWNTYVAPVVRPAEHFAQQMEEQVLRTFHRGLTLWHVVGVIVFGVLIYGLWRFTASSPSGWTRPEWGELIHNEGVTHQWYTQRGNGPRPVTTHVISKHVGMDPLSLLKRTMEEEHSSTSYYDMDDAQWAVDYALSTMTASERQRLENMMKNPRRAGTLVLNRTTSRAVGYGFKYDNGTITLEYDITSFQVTIRIDPNTGVPFIVTSFPTAT